MYGGDNTRESVSTGEGKYRWLPKALPNEARGWQRGKEVRVTETASFNVWELDKENQENQEIGEQVTDAAQGQN